MKKILLILSLLTGIFVLTACDRDNNESKKDEVEDIGGDNDSGKDETEDDSDNEGVDITPIEYDGPSIADEYRDSSRKFYNNPDNSNDSTRGGLIEVTLKNDFCVDGDTTRVNFPDSAGIPSGMQNNLRYFVIDTPEWTSYFDEFGKVATEYVCGILEEATTIELQSDIGDKNHDTYNRVLTWVWVDGKLLNYMIVRQGLALTTYDNFGNGHMDTKDGDTYLEHLYRAEDLAEADELKIHSNGKEKDPYWDYNNNRPLSSLNALSVIGI